MTLVMAYCVLLSAAVAAMATLGDQLLRARRLASRWLWMIAMMAIVPITGAVMIVPLRSPPTELQATVREIPVAALSGAVGIPLTQSRSWLALTDAGLTVLWISASVLLLGAIGVGRWRVTREKLRARRGQVQGHDVLLTKDLGPAVAGVRQPIVFVPEWVIALDDGSQQLLLAHEMEHARRRDTGMLMAGAALTAMLPWNPVAWWLSRRLRVAVELDCDARVLDTHPDVRRYADLLLVAAGKPRFTSRFLAAHFGEHASDLARRIDAMTNRSWRVRPLMLAAVAAVGLTMASCETPRPEPVAPLPGGEKEAPAAIVPGVRSGSTELASIAKRCTPDGGVGCQVSVIVRSNEGKELARYAGEIPVAEVPEGSIQSIEVEKASCGNVSCSLIWITLKAGEQLPKTPGTPVERKRGVSEKLEPKREEIVVANRRAYELARLRQSRPRLGAVRLDSSASLPRMADKREVVLERPRIILRDESAPRPQIILRDTTRAKVIPNVVIYSSTGEIVRELVGNVTRMPSKSALDDVKPEDIAAIEVYNGNTCPSSATLGCPLVKITLKPGREGPYRKR